MVERNAGSWRLAQGFLYSVDGVLGHGAMGSPFAAHDADQASLRIDFHFVVSCQSFRSRGAGGTYQRTRSGEAAYDLTRLYILGEIAINMAQKICNILL